MIAPKNIVTYEGLRKLEDELEYLKVTKRREISEKIKIAREQGDLSENAEYDAAKDEQRDSELRIEQLEKLLSNIEVIDEEIGDDIVHIGSRIRISSVLMDKEMEFKIVGATEAETLQGKISNESPVGQAFLGRKEGESVEVITPSGPIMYTLLKIL